MDQMIGAGAGIFGIVVIVFLVFLMILWTILPFAIFGIRPRIDEMIAELQNLNEQVEMLMDIRKRNHDNSF